MNILIVYGTTEGQTRKIVTRIGDWIRASGDQVQVVDSANLPEDLHVDKFDAYIVAGSLHMEKHQSSLVHFVKDHHERLTSVPSAFLSVSLTAIMKDDKSVSEAQSAIGKFIEQTGWIPKKHLCVAGALMFTEYDWMKRMLMKMIAQKEGINADTSVDHEFTDWVQLEQFIREFVASVAEIPVLVAH